MYVVTKSPSPSVYRPILCARFFASSFVNFAMGLPSSKSERPRQVRRPSEGITRGAPITDTDHFEPARAMEIGLPFAQISEKEGRRPPGHPGFSALP